MEIDEVFIKNLSEDELDDILIIQRQAYGSLLWEDKDVFSHKLHLFPQGCWIARLNGNPVAYLLSHPWLRSIIVPLNRKTDCLPPNPDCFYIHDLAVAPPFRRQGISRQLVKKAFGLARALQFNIVFLVSVQNSSTFWAKFGFELQEPLNQKMIEDLKSYDENARLMIAQI